jgi:hypothetical protein
MVIMRVLACMRVMMIGVNIGVAPKAFERFRTKQASAPSNGRKRIA